MRTMIICLAVAALGLAGAACKKGGEGGGDLCSAKSKCEKEEAPSAESIKECQDGLADKDCGPQNKAIIECAIANESCTPEGKSDKEALMTKCQAQMEAMMTCMAKKMEAAQPGGAPAAP